MKTKSDMFIKLHTICFSAVCYTVKHVLFEMIEIAPPYHIRYLRFLTPEYVSGVLIFLITYFLLQFSPAGVLLPAHTLGSRYSPVSGNRDHLFLNCHPEQILSFTLSM